MLGRSCLSLLGILFLPLLLPLNASGQAVRNNPRVDFGLSDLPILDSGPPPTLFVPTPIRTPPVPPVRISRPLGLTDLSSAAGIIFSGTVTKIARVPAKPGSVETVAITFHVEKAVRGATPGQDITITQWIGLWSSGQRYHVGERVLLLLYPPSKLGLTSAVGGDIGRFSIDPLGRVLLTPRHLVLTQADPILSGKARVAWSKFIEAVGRPGMRSQSRNGLDRNSERLP